VNDNCIIKCPLNRLGPGIVHGSTGGKAKNVKKKRGRNRGEKVRGKKRRYLDKRRKMGKGGREKERKGRGGNI